MLSLWVFEERAQGLLLGTISTPFKCTILSSPFLHLKSPIEGGTQKKEEEEGGGGCLTIMIWAPCLGRTEVLYMYIKYI